MSLHLKIHMAELIRGIFGFITAFFVAVAIIYTLEGPLKNLIAILAGTLVFLLYLYLTDSSYLNYNKINLYLHDIDKEMILTAYYFLSIIIVLLTSPVQGLYVDNWSLISPFNWLRLIAAFSLAAFLPGYAIIRTVNCKQEINGVPLVVFSSLVSFFLITFVSFILVILGLFLSYSVIALLLFNLAVAAIYCYLCVFRRGKVNVISSRLWRRDTLNMLQNIRGKLLPLLCLLILYSVLLYSVFFGYNSTLKGDMWRNMYNADMFLKGGFLERWGETFYPWFFSLFLAALSMLSGLPPVNTYLLAVFFNIFTILAFYALVSVFFKNKNSKVPMLATVIWTLFSGFGWIYALYQKSSVQSADIASWIGILQEAGNKTMNSTIFSNSYTHGYFTATVGLACLFMLIYLTRSEVSKAKRIFLVALVSALGFLVHVAEVVFFIAAVLLCFIVIYSKREDLIRLRTTIASVLVGLFIAIVIDVSASFQFYTTSTLLYVYIAMVIALIILTHIKEKFSLKQNSLEALHNFLHSAGIKKLLKFFAIPFLFYVYCLSFLIWLNVYPDFNMNASTWLWKIGLVPWYFYPLLYGVLGILTLVFITYAAYRGKGVLNGLGFFLILIPVTLIFARLITFTNLNWFYTDYYERRVAGIGLGIALSVIGALAITYFFSKLNSFHIRHARGIAKPAVASCILIAIIIGGSMSTFLTVDFWTLGGWEVYKISNEEAAALNYLKSNAPPSSLVITVTDESNTKLGLAGVTSLTKRWTFFEVKDPETAFFILAYTSYIYLHKHDIDELNKQPQTRNSYFMQHLKDHLAIAFNNSEVIIYKVPSFAPPSNSSFGLVYPNTMLTDRLVYPLEMTALSKLKYQVYLDTDGSRFSSSTLTIPYDPPSQPNFAEIGWIDDSFLTGWGIVGGGLGNGSAISDGSVFDIKPIDNWVALSKSCDVNIQNYPYMFINYTHTHLPGSHQTLHNVYFGINWSDTEGNEHNTIVYEGKSEKWDVAVVDLKSLLLNPYKVTKIIINPDANVEVKVDYIAFSKSVNTGWRDDDFKTGWQTFATFQLSNYSTSIDSGVLNITITSDTNNSASHALFDAITGLTVDIDKFPYLIQKRQVSHSECYGLETHVIIDGKGYFIGPTRPVNRETQVVDLRKIVTSGKLTEIRLIVQLEPWQTSTTVSGYWDYIALSKYPYPDLDPDSSSEYLNWVNNGGKLVVLNTYGHGFFANMLSISESGSSLANTILTKNNISMEFPSINIPMSFSSNNNVEIIANYAKNEQAASPYAYRMRLGAGEIIYVEALPYFLAIEKASDNLERSAFFKKFGSLIEILDLAASKIAEPQPPIRFAAGEEIILTGSVRLIAEGTSQDMGNVAIINLYISNITRTAVNGSKIGNLPAHGVLRQIKIIGPSESELSAYKLRLLALGRGGYMIATCEGPFNWTLKLLDGSVVYLELESEGSAFNMTAEGGSLTLSVETTPSLTMYVKNPEIITSGSSYFKQAYVDAPYSEKIDCDGDPLTINGQVAFEITISDSGTNTMGSPWLSYEGTVTVDRPSAQYWDEWKIPWISILTSPYHVLLINVIAVADVIIYIKREKSLRIGAILKKRNALELHNNA